jgi:hypothetical protein
MKLAPRGASLNDDRESPARWRDTRHPGVARPISRSGRKLRAAAGSSVDLDRDRDAEVTGEFGTPSPFGDIFGESEFENGSRASGGAFRCSNHDEFHES